MDKHVSVYYYWGVNLDSSTTSTVDELIGTCPFCNHNDTRSGIGHFYVNQKTAAFCCKSGSCGKEGSWRDFLEYIYLDRLKRTKDKDLLLLTQDQKLPLPILKKNKVAYDKKRQGFLYPIYNDAHQIIDLRIYRKTRKEESIKGSEVGVANLPQLLSVSADIPVYICESWRDQLALDWLLWRNNEPGIVCSTPGANTFKDHWAPYFQDKKIIICFDNDIAGYGFLDLEKGKVNGSRKVESYCKNYVSTTKFIIWSKEYPEKYDVRQFVIDNKQNPEEGLKKFKSMVFDHHKDDHKPNVVTNTSANISFDSIKKAAIDLYEVDDLFANAIKLALATAISPQIPGQDNVWLFLVGAPASGKTLVLNLLKKAKKCVWESSLSTKALVSGWGLGNAAMANALDPSILARVNNRCLVLKDYTEVLGKSQTEKDEIISILRGAYDGHVSRTFGNGRRDYNCSFAFLAGVTYEIRSYSTSSMGERFLQYEVRSRVPPEIIQEKALDAQLLGAQKVEILLDNVATFIDRNTYDNTGPALLGRVPRWFRDKVKPLARLIAHLRTNVSRFERGMRFGQMVYEPVVESGNRIAIQLEKLAIALALVENKPQIDEEIYDLIKQVGYDTAQSISTKLTFFLLQQNTSFTIKEISEQVGLKLNHAYLEDLEILKIIERNGTHGLKASFKPTKLIRDLWVRSL